MEESPKNKKRIAFIGKFARLYDEEYIARSFEMLGHEVLRLSPELGLNNLFARIDEWKPDICLFTKYEPPEGGKLFLQQLKKRGITSVCWLFDLYWDYPREHLIRAASYFRADVVATTDGGHEELWKKAGVNHILVRQGIYAPECYRDPIAKDPPHKVVFVGSDNALNEERSRTLRKLMRCYGNDFHWFGRMNTHEMRGGALNELYSDSAVVFGDSVWSPHYWSNRVVETLGRGGFLIHVDVPGIKDEYPYLVTYKRNAPEYLFSVIDHYLNNPGEREKIIQTNFEWVRHKYTMDKKCAELLSKI